MKQKILEILDKFGQYSELTDGKIIVDSSTGNEFEMIADGIVSQIEPLVMQGVSSADVLLAEEKTILKTLLVSKMTEFLFELDKCKKQKDIDRMTTQNEVMQNILKKLD